MGITVSIRLALCLVAFAAPGPQAHEPGRLVVHLHLEGAPAPEGHTRGTVVAEVLDAEVQDPLSIRVGGQIPGSVELQLPRARGWRIALEAEGFWAPAEIVETGKGRESVGLRVFPTGIVAGRLTGFQQAEVPELEATFLRRSNRGSHEGLVGRTSCSMGDRGEFACPVPAGMVDLRFEPEGWARHVLWNLPVEPAERLGVAAIEVRKGSAISGTVIDGTTGGPVAGAEVRVLPSALGELELAEEQRFRLAGASAAATEHGEFSVASIAPGSYDLVVEKRGWSPTRQLGIRIAPGSSIHLPEPLVLQRPATLELYLTPPLSPHGDAWQVLLLRETAPGGVELVDAGVPEVDPGGSWLANGLDPGVYTIHVGTESSPRWHDETAILEPGLNPLHLEIGLVPIRGTLSAGEDPVEGVLWFGGRSGRTSVRVATDSEGLFEGHLPHEGEWALDLTPEGSDGMQRLPSVEVARRPDGEPTLLEIVLPDAAVRGQVVDADGAPVADAVVEALNTAHRKLEATAHSDEKGRFEFAGIEPGTLYLRASREDERSRSELVDLEEGESVPEVTLVLEAERTLTGTILGPSGPIPGARVFAVPVVEGSGPVPVASLTTGADGRFSARFPENIKRLRVLAHAVGYALTALTLDVPVSDGALHVRLTPEGGVLQLHAGTEENLGRAMLIHEGTAFPVSIYGLVAGGDAGRTQGSHMIFRSMAPGSYALCPPVTAMKDTGAASAPPCDAAYLSPGGSVTLGSPQTGAE